MADRSGIEIDYCPECRGVWLDRGELDKIIERSAAERMATRPVAAPPPATQPTSAGPQAWPDPSRDPARDHRRSRDDDDDDDDDDRGRFLGDRSSSDSRYGKRKKKGLLGELFDF
jgi:uncharacterized protein